MNKTVSIVAMGGTLYDSGKTTYKNEIDARLAELFKQFAQIGACRRVAA